jgi:hypothetical protein
MFLLIGLLIGLNLSIRIAIGESRVLRSRGPANSGGKLGISPRDLLHIVYRGGLFLLGAVGIGLALDLAFDTTIGTLFG